MTRREFGRWALGVAGMAVAAGGVLSADVPRRAERPRSRAARLVRPAKLAARLRQGERPLILQVGFEVLYRGGHIPGAEYAGPASKAAGLAALRRRLLNLPREQVIVLYCGCCPWVKCPNIQPAAKMAAAMGFAHAELLYLEDSFAKDWAEAGYPVQTG